MIVLWLNRTSAYDYVKKIAQYRDVACSVSMQYKIPPKVLEIKYSPSQIFSLHFSIIRNNFAIKAFKDITILFKIVYIGFTVLERAFKVLERAFQKLEFWLMQYYIE